MATFEHSIIIPLEEYSKCEELLKLQNNSPSTQEPTQILLNTTLPKDAKLKLYHQQKLEQKNKGRKRTRSPPSPKPLTHEMGIQPDEVPQLSSAAQTDPTIPHISPDDHFQKSDRAKVEKILNKIASHWHELSWNDNYEIIVDGKLFEGSNVVEILKYLMRAKIVTKSTDIPVSVLEFYTKCIQIGIPQSLFVFNPPLRIAKKKGIRTPLRPTSSPVRASPVSKIKRTLALSPAPIFFTPEPQIGKGWIKY